MLRDYQARAIDQLYAWFNKTPTGNPCLVLPTGSGKSHIVAALCKDALQSWPKTKILMLTHVKELIVQNAEKMRLHWKGAPLGIYSAGIGKRQLGEPITLAAVVSQPIRLNNTWLGGLNGMGIAILRTSSTPGAPSISVTCVTSTCWLEPLIRAPLILSIVAELLMCAVSSKARREPVRAADRPPIR